MGYSMDLMDAHWKIPASQQHKCLELLKSTAVLEKLAASVGKGALGYSSLPVKATTLTEFINECCWECQIGPDGDLWINGFIGENLRDDFELFTLLAPFSDEGSFVQLVGEDHFVWRWIVKDGKCVEQSGRVVFDDE